MAKINDTDAVILANAAKRADLKVLPLPRGLKVKGAAANKILDKLVRTGLLASVAATHDDVPWGESDDGARKTLVVTAPGLHAIGIEAEASHTSRMSTTRTRPAKKGATTPHRAPTSAKSPKAAAKPPGKAASARAATKQALIVSMLRRANGASIAELAKATDWQPHSVRGVLTATIKGRLGLPLISEKGEHGVRRYYIAPISTSKAGAQS